MFRLDFTRSFSLTACALRYYPLLYKTKIRSRRFDSAARASNTRALILEHVKWATDAKMLRYSKEQFELAKERRPEYCLNTFMLRRKFPEPCLKRTKPPNHVPKLDSLKYELYDLLDWPARAKLPRVPVLLTKHIDGVGVIGDEIELPLLTAHYKITLGEALYATDENRSRLQSLHEKQTHVTHSSVYSNMTKKALEKTLLCVYMSGGDVSIDTHSHSTWTLSHCHVQTALRKAGFHTPCHCLQLPTIPIVGPDAASLERKIFLVTVTINNCEKAYVRCTIKHISDDCFLLNKPSKEEEGSGLLQDDQLPEYSLLFPEIDQTIIESLPALDEK